MMVVVLVRVLVVVVVVLLFLRGLYYILDIFGIWGLS